MKCLNKVLTYQLITANGINLKVRPFLGVGVEHLLQHASVETINILKQHQIIPLPDIMKEHLISNEKEASKSLHYNASVSYLSRAIS